LLYRRDVTKHRGRWEIRAGETGSGVTVPGPLTFWLKLVLTLIVLAWLLHLVPVTAILDAVADAQPAYVALGLAAQLGMRLAAALRMKLLADAQSLGLSTRRLLEVLLAANFYALLLPGTAAGGAATWVKYVQHGSAKGAAFLVILVNRLLAFNVMLACGALASATDDARPLVAVGLVGTAVLITLATIHVLFLRPSLLQSLVSLTTRVPVLRQPGLASRLDTLGGRLALFARLPKRTVTWLMMISFAHELLGVIVLWAFALALGLDLALPTVAWIRVAVQTVLMLPITIAGIGVREVTLVGLTTAQGIAPEAAVGWSLVIFAGTVAAALLGGVVEARALWRSGRRDRHAPLGDAAG
jgi:uncharacterized protein (TIRG00374 family)